MVHNYSVWGLLKPYLPRKILSLCFERPTHMYFYEDQCFVEILWRFDWYGMGWKEFTVGWCLASDTLDYQYSHYSERRGTHTVLSYEWVDMKSAMESALNDPYYEGLYLKYNVDLWQQAFESLQQYLHTTNQVGEFYEDRSL